MNDNSTTFDWRTEGQGPAGLDGVALKGRKEPLGESIRVRLMAKDRERLQEIAKRADLAEGTLIRRILVKWLTNLEEGGPI